MTAQLPVAKIVRAMAPVIAMDHSNSNARTTTTRTTILRIRTTTLLLPITDRASASRLGSKL